jgi:hypothetical protein
MRIRVRISPILATRNRGAGFGKVENPYLTLTRTIPVAKTRGLPLPLPIPTTFVLSFLGLSPSCPPSDASASFSEVCSPELQWPIGGDTPSAAVATAGKGRFGFFGSPVS